MSDISKTVIVTGASGEIGLATIETLLEHGYCVAACFHSNEIRLSGKVAQQQNLKTYKLNLSADDDIKDCSRQICAEATEVSGLVNCAGVASGSLFGMTKISDMRSLFQINFFGTLLFTQYVVKKMIRQKKGAIVNIGSTAGIFADSGTLSYGSSKAALLHASRVMAVELGPLGIRVNCVAPAVVETKMGNLMDEVSRSKLDDRGVLPNVTKPRDIADAVAFLISDKAASISAQIIRIDRGMPF